MTIGEAFPTVLSAARTGAEWAWTRLYNDLSPAVLGFLRAKRAPDPDDLLGEVFLDIVRSLDRFEGGEREFRAWALTICHRRLVDSRRRSAAAAPTVPLSDVDAGPVGDAEHDAFAALGIERVRGLIAKLSPGQQDVLLLRILGDMTVEEVAKAVGKRPGAVKALQRRALANLKREISSEGVPL